MPSTIVIHSHLLDGITASACSLPPFLPASDPRLPNARQGKVLSLHHLKGKSFAYMNTQLSKYNNLAAHPPTLRRFRANGSHPLIVDVAGMSKLNSQGGLLFFVWIDTILECFAHDHWTFCASMYRWTTLSDTAPTVAMKHERVHKDGNLDFIQGYSLPIVWAVFPLILRATASMPILGSTSSRRCTGSGITSISMIA